MKSLFNVTKANNALAAERKKPAPAEERRSPSSLRKSNPEQLECNKNGK